MFNLAGSATPAPSRAPVVLSAALHLAAGLGVAYLVAADTAPPAPLFRPPKSTLIYIPVVPIEIPTVTLAELRAPEPVVAAEPAPAAPAPAIAPPPEIRREDVEPIALPVEPPPAPPLPTPRPKPEVTVGSFEPVKTVAAVPERTRQIEIAGFDRIENPTAVPKQETTTVGAFDRSPDLKVRRQENPPETVTGVAGFNRSATVVSSAPEKQAVRDTGFGNSNPSTSPRAGSQEKPRAEIQSTSFDTAMTPPPASRNGAAPPPPRVVPAEVLFKPTPVYTEEARKLRIEGDVILEVEFLSVGSLRILRVIRGLGHGLDEAAVRAAEQIRFKPAQEGGRSIDSRATVNIVFRLA